MGLLLQGEDDFKQSLISGGHQYALRRARASLSAEAAVIELTSGYTAYRYLQNMIKAMNSQMPDWIRAFQSFQKRIFCIRRMTVGVTASKELPLHLLTDCLPAGDPAERPLFDYRLTFPKKQGIRIPSAVSYTGFALPRPVTDKAVWNVLSTVLSLEYLWNEVRVQGGAYGAGALLNVSGEASFYSYRDPSPVNTLSVYGKTADFLRQYGKTVSSLDSYIISTIAKQEPLLSEGVQGAIGEEHYFRGITWEERKERSRKLLTLTAADLLTACDLLEQDGSFCIVGPEEALKSCDLPDEWIESC